jgi:hypothetical protein
MQSNRCLGLGSFYQKSNHNVFGAYSSRFAGLGQEELNYSGRAMTFLKMNSTNNEIAMFMIDDLLLMIDDLRLTNKQNSNELYNSNIYT